MHLLKRTVLASILVTAVVLIHGRSPAQNKVADINKAELEKCLAK